MEVPNCALQPLVKAELKHEGGEDEYPRITSKKVPCSASELAKLKKEFSQTHKESDTEYVWGSVTIGGIRYC